MHAIAGDSIALSISKNYVFDGTSNYRFAIAHGRFLSMRPRCVHTIHSPCTQYLYYTVSNNARTEPDSAGDVSSSLLNQKKVIKFDKKEAFETPGTPILILYRYISRYSLLQFRVANPILPLYPVEFIAQFFFRTWKNGNSFSRKYFGVANWRKLRGKV